MEEFDLFKSDKMTKAVESIAEAVVITDPGGNITYVNPAFETITGYSSDDALGKNPRILKSGQNPPDRKLRKSLEEASLSNQSLGWGRLLRSPSRSNDRKFSDVFMGKDKNERINSGEIGE